MDRNSSKASQNPTRRLQGKVLLLEGLHLHPHQISPERTDKVDLFHAELHTNDRN